MGTPTIGSLHRRITAPKSIMYISTRTCLSPGCEQVWKEETNKSNPRKTASKVNASDRVAIVLEIEILKREVGRCRLVRILLAGIVRDGLGQKMHGSVSEHEVGAAGVPAG